MHKCSSTLWVCCQFLPSHSGWRLANTAWAWDLWGKAAPANLKKNNMNQFCNSRISRFRQTTTKMLASHGLMLQPHANPTQTWSTGPEQYVKRQMAVAGHVYQKGESCSSSNLLCQRDDSTWVFSPPHAQHPACLLPPPTRRAHRASRKSLLCFVHIHRISVPSGDSWPVSEILVVFLQWSSLYGMLCWISTGTVHQVQSARMPKPNFVCGFSHK